MRPGEKCKLCGCYVDEDGYCCCDDDFLEEEKDTELDNIFEPRPNEFYDDSSL